MEKIQRKKGRPKIDAADLRDQRLVIRLSQGELSKLTEAAAVDLSTWARDVLLRAAKRKIG